MNTALKTLPITKFHRDGTMPHHGEVFVFASNLAGDFSEGMAKQALKYGATGAVNSGREGKSWAIPVRDKNMVGLTFREIAVNVQDFLDHARERFRHDQFFISRIGGREWLLPSCGRPGRSLIVEDQVWVEESEIASLFMGAPVNCSFPEYWRQFLT